VNKLFGRRIEIDIEAGTTIVSKVCYEGRAKGCLILLAFDTRKEGLNRKPKESYFACPGWAHY
jgi:hypothetical protein